MSRLPATEILRQAIHIGAGCLALSLRWISPLHLSWVAFAGLLFNVVVLPRLGGLGLWRERERRSGRASGLVLYPLAVLLLLVIFAGRPEVAAAGWGMLAFGDGAASLAGLMWGRKKLPWNRAKSWAGWIAFWLVGTLAIAFLVQWVAPGAYDPGYVWAVSLGVALLAATLESMPTELDDNLAVPLIGALVLECCLWAEGGWSPLGGPEWVGRLALAVAINGALAGVAYKLAALGRSGWIASVVVGAVVLGFLGWRGYVLLLLFFLSGSVATRLGYRSKQLRGLAQENMGRRSVWNVMANGVVASACALFSVVTPFSQLFILAFAGAVAAAAADTLESEIGQLRGGSTFLITTFELVPVGSDGGVSLAGTVAGAVGSSILAISGGAIGLYPLRYVAIVAAAGFAATVLESLVGASLERRGRMGNDAVNLFNTLMGAVLAVGLLQLVS